MSAESQSTVPILEIAWKRYAQLDEISKKYAKPHFKWRGRIAALGVLAALLAVITQAYSEYMSATLSLALKILLIAAPITASVLAAFVNKFYDGSDWLVTRAGAEEIKKEIYMYRTFFKEKSDLERREWLEKRLANILRKVYRGMGGKIVLEESQRKLPPYYDDPGYHDLSGSEYLAYRLENQLVWHIGKVQKFEGERTRLQALILLAGGFGAFLAAMGGEFSIWVAVTASLGAALIGWQELRNLDAIIKNYSKVIMELMLTYDHWNMLEPEERTKGEVLQMVKSTEDVLWSQNIEYIKSMQEVLSKETLEEAELINGILKQAVKTDEAFKKSMRDSIVDGHTTVVDIARETLEAHFEEIVGSLANDASSELVQGELAAIGQAVSTRAAKLSDSLKQIAEEFADVEISRDTPAEVLNDILSRYPTTDEIKG